MRQTKPKGSAEGKTLDNNLQPETGQRKKKKSKQKENRFPTQTVH
jgi:hypothetical protein